MDSRRFYKLLQELSNEYDDLEAERNELEKELEAALLREDNLEGELEFVKDQLDTVGMD